MYLLIAWVWFLFAARCVLSICFFSLFSFYFCCLFCGQLVRSQEIGKHMHETRQKLSQQQGQKKVKLS